MKEKFGKLGLLLVLFVALGLFIGAECPKDDDNGNGNGNGNGTPTDDPPPPYKFEVTDQGWTAQTTAGDDGITSVEYTTDLAKDSTGSLKLNCSITGTAVGEADSADLNPNYLNLTGKTLSCDLYCPAGGGSLQAFFVLKDIGWNFATVTTGVTVTVGAWTSISASASLFTGIDLTQVRQIGLQIKGTHSGVLYLDNVNWQ